MTASGRPYTRRSPWVKCKLRRAGQGWTYHYVDGDEAILQRLFGQQVFAVGVVHYDHALDVVMGLARGEDMTCRFAGAKHVATLTIFEPLPIEENEVDLGGRAWSPRSEDWPEGVWRKLLDAFLGRGARQRVITSGGEVLVSKFRADARLGGHEQTLTALAERPNFTLLMVDVTRLVEPDPDVPFNAKVRRAPPLGHWRKVVRTTPVGEAREVVVEGMMARAMRNRIRKAAAEVGAEVELAHRPGGRNVVRFRRIA